MKRLAVLSLIAAFLWAGYHFLSPPIRERLARSFSLDHEIRVEVARAQKRALGRSLTARGELLPVKEVRVSATASGIVKEMPFNTGDRVGKGAVVALIESKDLGARLVDQEGAVREAQEHVKKAESHLLAAEKQLAAMRDLFEKNYIARREVELAESAAVTARAQKEAAEAQLAQRVSLSAQTRHVLASTRVTAPVVGVVTRRWAEPGARIGEGMPLVSLSQGETLKMVANVKSAETEKLPAGSATQVTVEGVPDRVFRGKITQIQESANFSGDESSVEIVVPNPNNILRAGMAATAAVRLEDAGEAILIPAAALVIEGSGRRRVFIVEKRRARAREVVTGRQQEGEVEVVSGLEGGESVVVSSVERLRDGSRVLVVQ